MLFLNKSFEPDNSLYVWLCIVMRFVVASAIIATPCQSGAQDLPLPRTSVSVVRVEEDATLVLNDGRIATLEAIEISDPQEAANQIRAMINDQNVTLDVVDMDRYGREVAYVSAGGKSIQQALVASGKAMVLAYRGDERIDGLLKAERAARQAHRGMWQSNQWVIDDKSAAQAMGMVRIVAGTIHAISIKSGVAYINFEEDWKHDFSIYVPKKTLRKMGKKNVQAMVGHKVFVRGLIQDYYGPRITLYEPEMLEDNASQSIRSY